MPRGGKREGAGRRSLEQQGRAEEKSVTRSITLPAFLWEWLAEHSADGSYSHALEALCEMRRQKLPEGYPLPGWKE
jgi:hypothetical protein